MPGSGGEMHVAMERCDRVLARKTKVPIGTKADDIRGHKRRVRGTATLVILGAGAGGVAEMHEGERRDDFLYVGSQQEQQYFGCSSESVPVAWHYGLSDTTTAHVA